MKTIFGGSGFLGEALVEKLKKEALRIVARNEGKLMELKRKYPNIEIMAGDVADMWTIKKAMKGAEDVLFCSAYKHVRTAEEEVFQCTKTNVYGLINALYESFNTKPKTFVFISTDKCAQISGVYACSKYVGEKLVEEASKINTETKYVVVRYGNVLKSTGSFLEIWKKNMEEGREIILTDPNCSRFFWTREMAVDFIFEAIENAKDAKPYIPNIKGISMGNALKACQKVWGDKSLVKIIGLQSGENLRETMDGKIFSDEVEQYTIDEFASFL